MGPEEGPNVNRRTNQLVFSTLRATVQLWGWLLFPDADWFQMRIGEQTREYQMDHYNDLSIQHSSKRSKCWRICCQHQSHLKRGVKIVGRHSGKERSRAPGEGGGGVGAPWEGVCEGVGAPREGVTFPPQPPSTIRRGNCWHTPPCTTKTSNHHIDHLATANQPYHQ